MTKRVRVLHAILIAMTLVLIGVASSRSALAAYPGANGKIVFVSDHDGNKEIYVMNPDGSGQTNLTHNLAADYEPEWSPDGSRIAFVSERDGNPHIYVMDADGQNVGQLTTGSWFDREPTWSPDGTRIAFISNRPSRVSGMEYSLFVMSSIDGSNVTELTADVREGVCVCEPDWSPVGTRIAFIGTYFPFLATMSSAGGNFLGPLPTNSFYYFYSQASPDWSPDGSKILFTGNYTQPNGSSLLTTDETGSTPVQITQNQASYNGAYSPDGSLIAFCRSASSSQSDIYTIRTDGTGEVRLTSSSGTNCEPDWQPTGVVLPTPTVTPTLQPTSTPSPTATPTPQPTPSLTPTATPPPVVGGISFDADAASTPERAASHQFGWLPFAALALVGVSVTGAVWFARRRWLQ